MLADFWVFGVQGLAIYQFFFSGGRVEAWLMCARRACDVGWREVIPEAEMVQLILANFRVIWMWGNVR